MVLYWEVLGELGFEFWKSSRAVFWKPPSFILKSVPPHPTVQEGGWGVGVDVDMRQEREEQQGPAAQGEGLEKGF